MKPSFILPTIKNALSWLVSAISIILLFAPGAPAAADDDKPNRIRIEYGQPKTSEHQALYDLMMQHRPLEKFQEIFSPFRLPIELTLRVRIATESRMPGMSARS